MIRCTTTGRPVTWRDLPRRSEPTPEYRAAKAALKERTEEAAQ